MTLIEYEHWKQLDRVREDEHNKQQAKQARQQRRGR